MNRIFRVFVRIVFESIVFEKIVFVVKYYVYYILFCFAFVFEFINYQSKTRNIITIACVARIIRCHAMKYCVQFIHEVILQFTHSEL